MKHPEQGHRQVRGAGRIGAGAPRTRHRSPSHGCVTGSAWIAVAMAAALAATVAPRDAAAQEPASTTAAVRQPVAAPQPSPPVAPSRPGLLTRVRLWSDEAQILPRLNGEVNGWYPRIGGITRGAGFAVGAGYRTPLANEALFLDLSGAISMKGYTSFDARLRVLQAAAQRLELWTEFRIEDFPEEDYFGRGMGTADDARTSYNFDSTDVRVRAQFQLQPWARLHATVGYRRPDVGAGTDGAVPSIETRFTDVTAPGLATQPNFVHTTFGADIDYRDVPGNPASGGVYRASFGIWHDATHDHFNFRRFDLQAIQYLPITRNKAHVLSGRVGASLVNNTDGHRVPFYFLPYVGGQDTIRSLREFRYKDENALWLGGEYKWRPKRFLSVMLFADAGKVSPNWRGLGVNDMRAGYGAGVGFHTSRQTITRIDVGTGSGEGWQVFIKFRPSF